MDLTKMDLLWFVVIIAFGVSVYGILSYLWEKNKVSVYLLLVGIELYNSYYIQRI